MAPPRIAYYGDDFTGATDTLATATRGGLRAMLFLRVPTPEMLSVAGELNVPSLPTQLTLYVTAFEPPLVRTSV